MPKSKSNSGNQKNAKGDRIVYSEFGNNASSPATEKAVPNLQPNQQNLRIQASRKGRKGKTVTIISGFQSNQETLTGLLKKLKNQCGAGGTLKDNEIEIQGEHKEKLLDILTKLGYQAKISGG
ncbi:MAG: translation initiation factor [Trichodesmium sp.]